MPEAVQHVDAVSTFTQGQEKEKRNLAGHSAATGVHGL